MTVNDWGASGTAGVPQGLSGVASNTAYAVLCGGTGSTTAIQPVASLGAAGTVLTSNGAGALPSFQAAGGGSLIYLNKQTASSSASIEWDNTYITSTYDHYIIYIKLSDPASDGAELFVRVSNDNGSTFETTNYDSTEWEAHKTTTGGTSTSAFLCCDAVGSGANEGNICGWIHIYNPTQSGIFTSGQSYMFFINNSGNNNVTWTSSQYEVTEANNAIQVLMDSGNIANGDYILYGVKES